MDSQNFNLKIDQNVCVRCGGCVVAYPDIFEFNADGNIQVKQNVEIEKIPVVLEVCPVGAILENK